jgi:pimeloyl-ACP methyl ester carboxylesterase
VFTKDKKCHQEHKDFHYQMKSSYADVNGIKMYYEIHGEGFPLVLIHGGGSTIQTTFGRILRFLSQSHLVIAVELQAHGHTSDRDAPESFQQDAADVVGLIQHLNISKADIFGFSNGGQTAMQIAITYPEKVNKLILGSVFYKRSGVPDVFWEGMKHAQFSDMPHQFKDEFMKIRNDSAALLNMFQKDVQRMQNFKGWSDDDLNSIKAPTLILSGDKDVGTVEHAVEMHRLIANSQLAIIPGNHGKYLGEITTLDNGNWTQEYVKELIEEFLEM